MYTKTLKRGFKTRAEREAVRYRELLQLKPTDPLPARRLAQHLGASIISPEQIPGMSERHIKRLLLIDNGSWSAITITPGKNSIIILNTSHAPNRHESSVMHEAAHLICEHEPGPVMQLPGFPFPLRTYNSECEAEAEYLGACLQLPRDALFWALKNGMSNEVIAEHYVASLNMVRFRRGVSGVNLQLSRMGVQV